MKANWPAPDHIAALTTTKLGGVSTLEYESNNLAMHVGDSSAAVQRNRDNLVHSLALVREPVWLIQTHSNRCIVVEEEDERNADAAITRNSVFPLAIMTADCLPVLLCDRKGTEIAAIHAGWRGLASGIIENTIEKMNNKTDSLLAWIGPAICQSCFEVGEDVRRNFKNRYTYADQIFRERGDKKLADLPRMAELILNQLGVYAVYHAGLCTYELHETFYSYRRQGLTGRMATLIWFKQGN
ncbi:peptidoglycan editing factor PgeF [Legionella londiniensis]|uniref:peptidoglycan editing factor PgeF n=1 Tax=Legionella londiniensis TaxID=45068 RepID=UPI0007318B56|nr:peptidoglycan editing factor PgeF [Legionella londiniensis]